jgi:hypothetical protein
MGFEELLKGDFLGISAKTLDGIETLRIETENRLRSLTRRKEDSDGDIRGFGYDMNQSAVRRAVSIVHAMKCNSKVVLELTGEKPSVKVGCCLEHEAERDLTKILKDHPLYPWFKAPERSGIGDKQGARFLAAVGDPYIRPSLLMHGDEADDKAHDNGVEEPARPRRGPDELKAYCGYNVVNGESPRYRKGVKANWNPEARMRLFLITESCLKAQGYYADVYYQEKEVYADATHKMACARCGPSGKPALPGSPISDGHRHGRGLKKVGQQILIDLWVESRRLHWELQPQAFIEAGYPRLPKESR